MSIDTNFKTITQNSGESEKVPSGEDSPVGQITNIEPPYLDYFDNTGRPYSVEYFSLGDTWEDPTGGFPNEIKRIEGYIEKKIKNGDIANSVSAVKNLIKDMEKVNNLNKEERAVVKIEVLSNYIDFISKNSEVFNNLKRYGN